MHYTPKFGEIKIFDKISGEGKWERRMLRDYVNAMKVYDKVRIVSSQFEGGEDSPYGPTLLPSVILRRLCEGSPP